MLHKSLHHIFAAVHDREDPFRQSRLKHQLSQEAWRERNLIGGFKNEGVPHRDRYGDHPHRNHRRKIERCDSYGDTERLANILTPNSPTHIERSTDIAILKPGGELKNLDPLEHLGPPLGDRLAALTRRAVREEFKVSHKEAPKGEQL